MSEMQKLYFNTGEFARLCGTTKETLFYYDRIGILKPDKVAPNGYRCYSCTQFLDYDLIRVLGQAGSSLKEIKWYLEHYDSHHFLSLLREKQEKIAIQRRRLEQMEQMLAHTVTMTERALGAVYGEPYIERQERELLLAVPLAPGEGERAEGIVARLAEHFARCEHYRLADKFPLGSIIPRENVLRGSDEESFFFSRVPADFEHEGLYQKPAGSYATILHKGKSETFGDAYRVLLRYIEEQGRVVCGNCYVYDLVSYLASGTEENFVYQISIQISPAPQ